MTIKITLPFVCVSAKDGQTTLAVPTVGDYSDASLNLFDKAMQMFSGLDESDREKVFAFAQTIEVKKMVAELVRVQLSDSEDDESSYDDLEDVSDFARYNMQNTIDEDEDDFLDD